MNLQFCQLDQVVRVRERERERESTSERASEQASA